MGLTRSASSAAKPVEVRVYRFGDQLVRSAVHRDGLGGDLSANELGEVKARHKSECDGLCDRPLHRDAAPPAQAQRLGGIHVGHRWKPPPSNHVTQNRRSSGS